MTRKSTLLLLVLIVPIMLAVYVAVAVFAGNALRRSHGQLQAGMPEEDVIKIMGRDYDVKYNGPRLGEVLTAEQHASCIYTLVFHNHYALDPYICCYFDVDNKLITSHRFE